MAFQFELKKTDLLYIFITILIFIQFYTYYLYKTELDALQLLHHEVLKTNLELSDAILKINKTLESIQNLKDSSITISSSQINSNKSITQTEIYRDVLKYLALAISIIRVLNGSFSLYNQLSESSIFLSFEKMDNFFLNWLRTDRINVNDSKYLLIHDESTNQVLKVVLSGDQDLESGLYFYDESSQLITFSQFLIRHKTEMSFADAQRNELIDEFASSNLF